MFNRTQRVNNGQYGFGKKLTVNGKVLEICDRPHTNGLLIFLYFKDGKFMTYKRTGTFAKEIFFELFDSSKVVLDCIENLDKMPGNNVLSGDGKTLYARSKSSVLLWRNEVIGSQSNWTIEQTFPLAGCYSGQFNSMQIASRTNRVKFLFKPWA